MPPAEVRLLGAMIGATLDCTGGRFTNPNGDALSCDRAKITGSVFLRDKFNATGAVRLPGAIIDGTLDCSGGEFTNSDDYALIFDGAKITGDVFLNDEFSAHGAVRLRGATVGGSLDCRGGLFAQPDGDALEFDNTQVTGSVFLGSGFRADGSVRLTGMSCSVLHDEADSWPQTCALDGFQFRQLQSPELAWKQRRVWLRRQTTPSPGPYTQLASVYRTVGRDRDARKILIERHNTLIDPPGALEVELAHGTAWRRIPRPAAVPSLHDRPWLRTVAASSASSSRSSRS